MITQEQIEDWKALCEEATLGAWDYERFAAEARTAMPELLAEVERLNMMLGIFANILAMINPPACPPGKGFCSGALIPDTDESSSCPNCWKKYAEQAAINAIEEAGK